MRVAAFVFVLAPPALCVFPFFLVLGRGGRRRGRPSLCVLVRFECPHQACVSDLGIVFLHHIATRVEKYGDGFDVRYWIDVIWVRLADVEFLI